jgi:hypothetical protein
VPYEIIWESRCVTRRFHGRVTGQEIVATLREVGGDSRFDELLGTLVDYRDVGTLDLSEEDAAMIVALQIGCAFTNHRQVAAIVASDPRVVETLSALVAQYQAPIEVSFHPTLGAARRWLAARGALDPSSPDRPATEAATGPAA